MLELLGVRYSLFRNGTNNSFSCIYRADDLYPTSVTKLTVRCFFISFSCLNVRVLKKVI